MREFGDLLRAYRHKCRDPKSGATLTQARLAELLGIESEMEGYSGATVSNWERGNNQIRRDDRHVLVGLLKVLYQCGGIRTREEANQLLLAGNYRPLNDRETSRINPVWKVEKSTRESETSSFPSIEEQEAMLPPPSYSRLFGMEEAIDHLVRQLSSPKSPYLLVIVGLGGIGKTVLADAVARAVIRQHEFVGVIWFSAEVLQDVYEPEKPESASLFETIINALYQQILADGVRENNPARRLTRVRNELKRHRYLIIIDNLEDATETNRLLMQLNTLAEPSKFLLTSRHYPSPRVEAYAFPLRELAAQDVTRFLRHQAEVSGASALVQSTDQELAQVYHVMGGHPMALRFVVSLARMYPLTQILAGWQKGQAGYITQVYRSIYQPLWQTLQPAEKQLLEVMPLVAQVGATIGQLQFVSDLPDSLFWPALTKLLEVCLVEPRGTLLAQRYGIHSLTVHFLQGYVWENETELAGSTPAERVYANVVYWRQYLNNLADKEWHTLDVERANIFRAIQFSLMLAKDEVTPSLKETWRTLSELMFRFIEQRGYAQEWIPLLEQLAIQFEDDKSAQCRLFVRLGELYRLGQQLPKAIKTHQKALQIAQQIKDEWEAARACFNLGTDYFRDNQYEIAARYGQSALQRFEDLGLSGRETAATLNLLGTIAQAQTNFDMSEHYLREAVSIWRQLNYPSELTRTLNNLALTLQRQQRVEEAFDCYARAKAALANSASELDRVLIHLSEGTLYFDLGHYLEAEATFKRINLAFLKEGGHLLYQALTLNNLGNVAFMRGDYTKTENLLRESASIWRKIGNEVELANTLSRLGDVYRMQEKVETAGSLYDEVVALTARYPEEVRASELKREAEQQLKEIYHQRQWG